MTIPTPTENVIKSVKNDLIVIYKIDTKIERGYDRSLFVSSIVNKIKTQAKNKNSLTVIETVDFIESMNNWAIKNGSKQLISSKSPVWNLRAAMRELEQKNKGELK